MPGLGRVMPGHRGGLNGIDVALVPLHAGVGVPKRRLERLMPATWQFRNGIDMALVPLPAGLGVPKRRLQRLMPGQKVPRGSFETV